jgi:hypothetical protein
MSHIALALVATSTAALMWLPTKGVVDKRIQVRGEVLRVFDFIAGLGPD